MKLQVQQRKQQLYYFVLLLLFACRGQSVSTNGRIGVYFLCAFICASTRVQMMKMLIRETCNII